MFVSTPAKTEITKGLGRSTGLTSGPLGRPGSLDRIDNRGGLAPLMTELKSSTFRATALTLNTCHPFPAESKGTTVIPEALRTGQHPIPRAKPLSRDTLSRPKMGKLRFLVDTPAALAAFREEYDVPADVHLELAEEETTPWGREECPFTVLSIVEGGLRFPLNPLITEFLRRTGLAPTQVSTNTYRIINGVHELNKRLGTNLGLAEILRQYTMGHTGDGLAYYLKIRPGKEKIVTGTPDKDMHDDDFFWVSGNYETVEVPGWFISKDFGSSSIQALQANYQFPNVEAIRAVLRYRHRDCNDLLGYTPTYRYSAPRRSRVTDFLRAPSPPPDPTLPDVPLIRLTEEQEMAKRSRIKNLLTATSAELPSVVTRSPAAGQSSSAVVALATPSAGQSSREPSARRAGKRARADPSAELVTELTTEHPTDAPAPVPAWRPHLKHRGQDIPTTASIKADKEHLLAFDLSKALLLPSDVVGSDHVPDTRLVKSSVKSMARAIQKQHLVLERIHRLRQKANDTASQVESLQAELGRAKASLEMANTDNNRLLGQLNAAEKKQSELQTEVDTLKKSEKKACRAANNAGFNEAEKNYKKQVFATQDIYFKAGWKSACEQLGQGSDTDVFANPPKASLPVYLVPYANDVFSALQAEAEEGLEDGDGETDSEEEVAEVHQLIQPEYIISVGNPKLDKTPTLPTGVHHLGWESKVGEDTNSSNRSTSSRLGIQSWTRHQLFQPEYIISVGNPKLDKTPTLPTGVHHLGWESKVGQNTNSSNRSTSSRPVTLKQ
ncbi:hypothetical protein CsSME_00051008 [Camellia sinensis var. sinensis]